MHSAAHHKGGTEQDSPMSKGLHRREFKVEHRNFLFHGKISWIPRWNKSLSLLIDITITSWRKINNMLYHCSFSKNFIFKCLNMCKQKKLAFVHVSNQIRFKTSNTKTQQSNAIIAYYFCVVLDSQAVAATLWAGHHCLSQTYLLLKWLVKSWFN